MAPRPTVAQEARALPDTLSLDRAISLALEMNPDLRTSAAQADAAGAGQLAAWGALLPTASLGLGLNRNDFTRTTFLGEQGTSETLPELLQSSSQGASQSFSLNWTAFDLGRIANLRQQSANVRAAQRRLDDQRVAVVTAAKRAFYEALRRQRLLELTELQIQDRQLELDVAQRRYEIAAVERTDVLQAESNLLNAQITLLNERREVDNALRVLSVALGLPPEQAEGTVLRDIDALPEAGEGGREAIVETALRSDPELLAYEADRTVASAQLWGVRSRYIPTITASLNWSRSEQFGPGSSFFQFSPGDTGRSFSVQASWNLFDGFSREQQTAAAASQRRQAEEGLRGRRLEIEREMRGFLDQIDQLAQALSLLERSLQIAQERLDMTRQMYQLGNAQYTQLQQAIGDVTLAQSQLIAQRFDYLIAWANLEEYTGVSR